MELTFIFQNKELFLKLLAFISDIFNTGAGCLGRMQRF